MKRDRDGAGEDFVLERKSSGGGRVIKGDGGRSIPDAMGPSERGRAEW